MVLQDVRVTLAFQHQSAHCVFSASAAKTLKLWDCRKTEVRYLSGANLAVIDDQVKAICGFPFTGGEVAVFAGSTPDWVAETGHMCSGRSLFARSSRRGCSRHCVAI